MFFVCFSPVSTETWSPHDTFSILPAQTHNVSLIVAPIYFRTYMTASCLFRFRVPELGWFSGCGGEAWDPMGVTCQHTRYTKTNKYSQPTLAKTVKLDTCAGFIGGARGPAIPLPVSPLPHTLTLSTSAQEWVSEHAGFLLPFLDKSASLGRCRPLCVVCTLSHSKHLILCHSNSCF